MDSSLAAVFFVVMAKVSVIDSTKDNEVFITVSGVFIVTWTAV